MEKNDDEFNLIISIYLDMIEIEAMLKALKQIKADIVIFSPKDDVLIFSPCDKNNVLIDAPMFASYLKEETIKHYTVHLEKLTKQLENL
jgi:hypothetical protein